MTEHTPPLAIDPTLLSKRKHTLSEKDIGDGASRAPKIAKSDFHSDITSLDRSKEGKPSKDTNEAAQDLTPTSLETRPANVAAGSAERPEYAGLIVASKHISLELQAFLYSKRIFRAHLCKFTDNNLPIPPPAVGRIENLEILLDQTRSPRATTLHWPEQERYYRTWYQALAGAAYQRTTCRTIISNIIIETFVTQDFEIVHVPSVTELLAAREKLIGFSTVIMDLGEAPIHLPGDQSQSPEFQSATGLVEDAAYSGPAFEGLKALFASTLETVLGPCVYFDRGNFRCLEFRPGDEVPTGLI